MSTVVRLRRELRLEARRDRRDVGSHGSPSGRSSAPRLSEVSGPCRGERSLRMCKEHAGLGSQRIPSASRTELGVLDHTTHHGLRVGRGTHPAGRRSGGRRSGNPPRRWCRRGATSVVSRRQRERGEASGDTGCAPADSARRRRARRRLRADRRTTATLERGRPPPRGEGREGAPAGDSTDGRVACFGKRSVHHRVHGPLAARWSAWRRHNARGRVVRPGRPHLMGAKKCPQGTCRGEPATRLRAPRGPGETNDVAGAAAQARPPRWAGE